MGVPFAKLDDALDCLESDIERIEEIARNNPQDCFHPERLSAAGLKLLNLCQTITAAKKAAEENPDEI